MLVLATLVLLTACTSPGCDANQAGFFSGIGNAASGCYARQNDAYKAQLSVTQANANAAANQAAYESQRAAGQQQNVAMLQGRLASLNNDAASMQRRLSAARGQAGVSEASYARAQQAIEDLRRQNEAAAASPTPQAVSEAEAKKRQAEKTLHDLLLQ